MLFKASSSWVGRKPPGRKRTCRCCLALPPSVVGQPHGDRSFRMRGLALLPKTPPESVLVFCGGAESDPENQRPVKKMLIHYCCLTSLLVNSSLVGFFFFLPRITAYRSLLLNFTYVLLKENKTFVLCKFKPFVPLKNVFSLDAFSLIVVL